MPLLHPAEALGLLIGAAAGMMDSLKSMPVGNIPRNKLDTLSLKESPYEDIPYLHEPRRNTLSVPIHKPAGVEK